MSPEEKDRKIERLEQENQALRERIAELERRLGVDSQTSSKPPSSDGLKKLSKIRTKSLRETGKRRSGGQLGHPGQTLEQVIRPDKIVEHPTPCSCPGCGYDISVVVVKKIIKRQVFDIPAPQIVVTQHQVAVKECPECKAQIQGSFPEYITAPAQYGARIRAVAAYLNHQHFIPEDRLSEVLMDLFGCRMTAGTIANTSKTLAQIIEPAVAVVVEAVKTSAVKHLDETGLRIGGKTNWLHVVATETHTWYRVAAQRKDIEVLANIKGVVVHDHWNPYYQIQDVNHALCNAHHLRELKALEEIEQEPWAKSMKKFLLLACNYKHRYPKGIPKSIVARLQQLYEQILQRGLSFHHSQPPLIRQGHRGRVKRRVGHNLLLRLQNFRGDVLRFLTAPDVPFTNNQAERDLRMMKCKQKISGGFRSFDFAVSFANIRSFLSTASKHSLNLLDLITEALQGNISVFLSSTTTS